MYKWKWHKIEGTDYELGISMKNGIHESRLRSPKSASQALSMMQYQQITKVLNRIGDQLHDEISKEVTGEHRDELLERKERFLSIFGPLAYIFWPITARIWLWQLDRAADRAFEKMLWEACEREVREILTAAEPTPDTQSRASLGAIEINVMDKSVR